MKEENEKTKKYSRVINFIILNLLIKLITLYKVINKNNTILKPRRVPSPAPLQETRDLCG